jgi:hypothetical protein
VRLVEKRERRTVMVLLLLLLNCSTQRDGKDGQA